MPDLHVNSLRYTLLPFEDVSFTNPPPMEFETAGARFRLADGKLTCEMKTHFASADDARRAVDPTMRAWEIDADLRWGRSGLKFRFDGADVIDRTPAPPGGGPRLRVRSGCWNRNGDWHGHGPRHSLYVSCASASDVLPES